MQLSYQYENFEEEVDIEPINDRLERAPLIHIIGDDLSMLIILKDGLEKQGWMVLTNTDPKKATNQYFDLLPDCLVIDLDMSLKSGFELLKDIHEHNKRQFVPKVILSGNNSREERMENKFSVYNFTKAKDAIDQLSLDVPDAIVLDLNLEIGEMDGREFMRELKKMDAKFRDIPIIISSALEEKDKSFALGAIDYLVKPYKASDLSRTILQILLMKEKRVKFLFQIRINEGSFG